MKIKRASIPKIAANLIPFLSYPVASAMFNLRNRLPEPFDYADHAGNVMAGITIGVTLGTVAANTYVNTVPEEQQTPSRLRLRAAAFATSCALAVNAVVETRAGQAIVPEFLVSTPDVIDFVYGVGSAAISGAMIPTIVKEP